VLGLRERKAFLVVVAARCKGKRKDAVKGKYMSLFTSLTFPASSSSSIYFAAQL
jgi:hypothetical protein